MIQTAEFEDVNMISDWTGSLVGGTVVVEDLNENVAAPGTAEAIQEARAALISGERHVFDVSSFTVNGKQFSTYFADVDYDDLYTPDTQVVSDGYYMESFYRSAPYFDVTVDGIEGGGWGF